MFDPKLEYEHAIICPYICRGSYDVFGISCVWFRKQNISSLTVQSTATTEEEQKHSELPSTKTSGSTSLGVF